jgi:hypothetical protein
MDGFIKWSSVVAVALLAGVAGWVSYTHALDVVRLYGQAGAVAYAYPTTIDGLIYVPGMFLLNHARQGGEHDGPFWYAWTLVGIGAIVTGAANAISGLAHGVPGAIVSAWPAAALVLAYEMLMLLIRSMAREHSETAETPSVSKTFGGVAAVPDSPASVPGVREIMRDLKMGHKNAKKHREALMNGAAK